MCLLNWGLVLVIIWYQWHFHWILIYVLLWKNSFVPFEFKTVWYGFLEKASLMPLQSKLKFIGFVLLFIGWAFSIELWWKCLENYNQQYWIKCGRAVHFAGYKLQAPLYSESHDYYGINEYYLWLVSMAKVTILFEHLIV